MPVDPQIAAAMPHRFVWNRKTGQDAWQNPTFDDTHEPLVGLFNADVHEVTDSNGQKRTSTSVVYLADVYGVATGDRLEFNGQDLGEVIRVEEWPHPVTGAAYGSVVHHG